MVLCGTSYRGLVPQFERASIETLATKDAVNVLLNVQLNVESSIFAYFESLIL